jgi:hypothetical protein
MVGRSARTTDLALYQGAFKLIKQNSMNYLSEQLKLSWRNSIFHASKPAMLQRLHLHPNSPLDPSFNHVAALKSLVEAPVMAMSTALGAERDGFPNRRQAKRLPRLKLGELLILTTTKFVETCFVSWCICASMNLA